MESSDELKLTDAHGQEIDQAPSVDVATSMFTIYLGSNAKDDKRCIAILEIEGEEVARSAVEMIRSLGILTWYEETKHEDPDGVSKDDQQESKGSD